jgi:hypothetical protein
MERIRKLFFAQLMVIYTRYLLGAAFVFASIIKMKGQRFTSSSGESAPIHSNLHYFETMYQSGLYWRFIGLCQFLAGALLMTQVFCFFGAVIYFPVILNIFIITLSYEFGFTPVITGCMLLANLMLLFWDWNKLKIFFNQKPLAGNNDEIDQKKLWAFTGFILLLFTTVYRTIYDRYNFMFWSIGFILITGVGFLIYILKRSRGSKMLQ